MPSLEAQLSPLTTTQFRLRLRDVFGVDLLAKPTHKRIRPMSSVSPSTLHSERPEIWMELCAQYRTDLAATRTLRRFAGTTLPLSRTQALLKALQEVQWTTLVPDRNG
jgi:hypothetical protein